MDLNLHDRDTMIATLPKGGVIAEIGVDWGEFSKYILAQAKPKLLYLIDCWLQQSRAVCGSDPANYEPHLKQKAYQQVLDWFGNNPQCRVMRNFSLYAACTFPDGYFDWIFLDANHLQCHQDMEAWWPKIKSGGWMTGHDYCMVADFITVQRDVDRWMKEHPDLKLLLTDEEIYKCWLVQKP